MDLRELFVYFVVLCSSVADAIRCKCTKESETVTCIDGICEMDPGCKFSETSAVRFSLFAFPVVPSTCNVRDTCVRQRNSCGLSDFLHSQLCECVGLVLFSGDSISYNSQLTSCSSY
ncbi:unnamed protein product [Haemonchus placei]|uniref:EB domain-containing protein n=1 Tax=Haemonchus placei TaxID=6290 RepID=A0A0N4X800_HAEPC|nr:unnamed protein product [Haemonchus placei]